MRRVSKQYYFLFSRGQQFVGRRGVAQYGVTLLSHKEILAKYAPQQAPPLQPPQGALANYATLIGLVERVEQCLFHWRLNKWEFRLPVLLSQEEKDRSMTQLQRIKAEILGRLATQQRVHEDLALLQGTFGLDEAAIRTKTRAWIQEQVSELRWKGDVHTAREVREAWVRLENTGSRECALLQRLCCIYGLARLGTFDNAFSNFIVPKSFLISASKDDNVSKFRGRITGGPESSENTFPVALDTSNPFQELMQQIVASVPSIDICYDFMGYNPTDGYRVSLGKYLRLSLEAKNKASSSSSNPRDPRILYSTRDSSGKRELLFDNARNDTVDFVHLAGNDITLIAVASGNKWKAQAQLPHRKQMEGVARRAAFVLGLQYDDVRVRNLFLPPAYLDRRNLDRINRLVAEGTAHPYVASWVGSYQLELRPEDDDYAVQAAKYPEEEWVKL